MMQDSRVGEGDLILQNRNNLLWCSCQKCYFCQWRSQLAVRTKCLKPDVGRHACGPFIHYIGFWKKGIPLKLGPKAALKYPPFKKHKSYNGAARPRIVTYCNSSCVGWSACYPLSTFLQFLRRTCRGHASIHSWVLRGTEIQIILWTWHLLYWSYKYNKYNGYC